MVDVRIDALSATVVIAGPLDARIDAVSATVILRGSVDARIDALSATVIMGLNLEFAPFSIEAVDVFPVVEMAPFSMAAISTGFTLAGGTDLWIPATMLTQNILVWLPDPPASLELPSEGAWGVIVVINH